MYKSDFLKHQFDQITVILKTGFPWFSINYKTNRNILQNRKGSSWNSLYLYFLSCFCHSWTCPLMLQMYWNTCTPSRRPCPLHPLSLCPCAQIGTFCSHHSSNHHVVAQPSTSRQWFWCEFFPGPHAERSWLFSSSVLLRPFLYSLVIAFCILYYSYFLCPHPQHHVPWSPQEVFSQLDGVIPEGRALESRTAISHLLRAQGRLGMFPGWLYFQCKSGRNIYPGNFPTIQLPTSMESLWLYILKPFVICCPLVVREISFHLSTTMWLEDKLSGFPGSQSGWESTCQCRGHRFDPWSRKIPPAVKQLSPCSTTTEPSWHNYWTPCTLEPMVHGNEKPCIMTKSSPHSPQLEKTLT